VIAWFDPVKSVASNRVQHESLRELKVRSLCTNRLFPRHSLSTLQMGSPAHPSRWPG
jgi:hypothetical protein